MPVVLLRGNARRLPLPDNSVDLICTSPPYYGLRSYGGCYDEQVGAEDDPQQYIANLLDCTREWTRVLKDTGSLLVNLGDVYAAYNRNRGPSRSLSASADAGRGHVALRGLPGQAPDEPPADYAGVPGRGICRPGRPAEWTIANAAWLAAVLDCEGSVSARILKDGRSFVAWMRVGMMDREVVNRIHEITGVGRVFQDGRGVWNYHVASQAARYVLERIWPWLLIKQKRALAAIELCRHVEKRAARQGRMLTGGDLAYRTMIAQAIRDWNGHPARPNDYEPPVPPKISLPDRPAAATRAKSMMGLPWRYALACIDELGLILRSDIIWSKPNGLPASVDDRVRSSHEYVFHLVKSPRYFTGVDEIREPHSAASAARMAPGRAPTGRRPASIYNGHPEQTLSLEKGLHPLGRLPGSVWTIPLQPLVGPQCRLVWGGRTVRWFGTWDEGYAYMRDLGRDVNHPWAVRLGRPSLRPEDEHYAAYPMELPRRAILGWSPNGICTACGQGRRPVSDVTREYGWTRHTDSVRVRDGTGHAGKNAGQQVTNRRLATITGYACDCPDSSAPTRPAVVLDPFGGTGTTAMVASALGRTGISVDYSGSYCRFARWRTADPPERAKAMGVRKPPPPPPDRQGSLFDIGEFAM